VGGLAALTRRPISPGPAAVALILPVAADSGTVPGVSSRSYDRALMRRTAIREAVLARAPLLATAAWWYWTLHRQARGMKRAAADPRSAEEFLAAVPGGSTILEINGHRLLDARATVGPARAIQRREELLELLECVRKLRPRRVCEIGTASGGTLYFLTRAAHESALIVSIDIATPPYTRFTRSKLARTKQRVISLEGDSHATETMERLLALLDGEPLDFLFVDGDHSYDGVKRDFELYGPLVRPGGLIALHDINPDSGNPAGPISGDVPRVWAELRESHRTEEIVHAPPGEGLGIGIVHP
jgi:predicted O-methyltransferase YrrM